MVITRAACLAALLLAAFFVYAHAAPPEAESPQARSAEANAQAPAEDEAKFIRLLRDDDQQPLAMQTAIVRYAPADGKNRGLRVDLIGAVHVGEKDYYEALNKEFEQYDVLLYELVAPDDAAVPAAGERSGHPIALLQNGMKGLLGLEHQLEWIDYGKKNFVHADMSPDDFAQSMRNRDETMLSMFFRMMGQGIALQSKQQAKDPNRSTDAEMLFALFAEDRAVRLKRLMAEQFEDMEDMMAALDGPDGSTIITERNKVAFEVLDEQIRRGVKRIGVFYGAGHFEDMEKRLIDEFGLKRQETRWLTAWDLRSDAQKAAE